MTFLAMIAALVLLQAWGAGGPLHNDTWFRSWQSRVAQQELAPWLRLSAAVLAPAVLAALVLDALQPALFGLLWFGAAVLLLLYAFGRGDYRAAMERYRRYCRSGDFEGAWLAAQTAWGSGFSPGAPDTSEDVHRIVQRGLFYQGYQRWFAVLFYYLLLGPAGALGYRLLQLCRDQLEPPLCARALFVLDWLPARLLAGLFVLAGDFVGSREQLLVYLSDTDADAGTVLHAVGSAALGGEQQAGVGVGAEATEFGERAAAENRAAEELMTRSAGAWLIVTSVLTLLF